MKKETYEAIIAEIEAQAQEYIYMGMAYKEAADALREKLEGDGYGEDTEGT